MSVNTHDIGDGVTLGNCTTAVNARAPSTWEPFKNLLNAAADPTTVTLSVKKPDGTTTVYTHGGSPALQKESIGRYYVHVTIDQAGFWHCELKGTGAVITEFEWVFYVRLSEVG